MTTQTDEERALVSLLYDVVGCVDNCHNCLAFAPIELKERIDAFWREHYPEEVVDESRVEA